MNVFFIQLGTFHELTPLDYLISHGEGYFMQCPRCRGRMFSEKFYDFVRSFDAWKCTCCGELLDSTILVNRARSNNSHLG